LSRICPAAEQFRGGDLNFAGHHGGNRTGRHRAVGTAADACRRQYAARHSPHSGGRHQRSRPAARSRSMNMPGLRTRRP
jgi:hypothetical protein